MRRRVGSTLGAVIALVGAVFTLQGVGALGGSFMTGSATWAVVGVVLVAVGLLVAARAR